MALVAETTDRVRPESIRLDAGDIQALALVAAHFVSSGYVSIAEYDKAAKRAVEIYTKTVAAMHEHNKTAR